MRAQLQPGPVRVERISIVAGEAERFTATLPAGVPVNEAIAKAFQAKGYRGGVMEMRGGAFAPLRFVIPALSSDPRYAAYYSETHGGPGPARFVQMNATVGEKDGKPFSHLHGSWTGPEGRPQAGHVLPLETMLAEPVLATGWAIEGAGFVVRPDAETNFSLFMPERWGRAPAEASGALVKIQPNEDACLALEEACTRLGWRSARVRGGVGSLVGARFADGRLLEAVATEVLVQEGGVAPDFSGCPKASLSVLAVDERGLIAEGALAHGDNPVLMTFELLLVPG
ncbi:DUF296 domain-containing protein [Acetobacteraceae bacterium H6797]|nr:DUF296 domain-containing protein [Acetobacteraceae bacterium H6797]